MNINRKVFTLAAFLTAAIGIMEYQNNNTNLSYAVSHAPSSADPIDYDLFVHHDIFRSVFSGLVSQYKKGEYVGILAESWKSSDNFKTWEFVLRPNLEFENGDKITPEIVEKSLLRAGYLLNKKNSKDGLLSNLIGFENIRTPNSQILGLTVYENRINFKFVKPMPQTLELVSFGLYSIVHPNSFDRQSGSWIAGKKFLSSGPYRVKNWDDSTISLILREDFLTGLGHPKKFKEINFFWNKPTENADVVSSDEFIDLGKYGYTYFGGARSGTLYMHCLSWANPNSQLHSTSLRRNLRDLFYSKMKEIYPITSSFFPLAIAGVSEPVESFPEPKENLEFKVKTPLNINKSGLGSEEFREAYSAAWNKISEKKNLDVHEVKVDPKILWESLTPSHKDFAADIVIIATNILVESPDDDIRFMFLSKEGIRLPDSTGSIKDLLQQENLDYQRINNLLWDQAIVWPITHFSQGIWIKPHVDVSLLNTLKPPIDLFWVGSK